MGRADARAYPPDILTPMSPCHGCINQHVTLAPMGRHGLLSLRTGSPRWLEPSGALWGGKRGRSRADVDRHVITLAMTVILCAAPAWLLSVHNQRQHHVRPGSREWEHGEHCLNVLPSCRPIFRLTFDTKQTFTISQFAHTRT